MKKKYEMFSKFYDFTKKKVYIQFVIEKILLPKITHYQKHTKNNLL